MVDFNFQQVPSNDAMETLRQEVRDFLAVEIGDRKPAERALSWAGHDAAFSRKVGERGWLGMTWPGRYCGHERSALERYVVLEEMLTAGAPVSAHWIADRQSGPLILRVGTEEQRQRYLPGIARGEIFFCAGLSEPDTGSDLASARTRAVETDAGWVVNGTKIWNTNGHRSHYMILFCRTDAPSSDARHSGFSQFIVDMSLPGIEVRPILDMAGEHHLNEIHFSDALLPKDALLGPKGSGWQQVISELAHERSGPERFLSSFPLLVELARALGDSPSAHAAASLGRLAGQVAVLRQMSLSVAGMLQRGEDPTVAAAIVKDLGAVLEQEVIEVARLLVATEPDLTGQDFAASLATTLLASPSFSLRGGAREILRGIIARGLNLR
ncbi:acyl-CoA dehydrogenase [Sphingobium amiense]|uniref:Acyl-CoA dehydrogenase n=1 Tax=Sphingobium amiense TaxID=135719 RepID=A0A494W1B7_9SPHN|nr:acyl-CoA dehydrogenase family protein [Sphingobium amiense]BBD98404.1 acyl-CoA dehydrogenase [Sphingobium amiense]